jgi:iron-sulfur cluster repair protein YtfE (RIC family)
MNVNRESHVTVRACYDERPEQKRSRSFLAGDEDALLKYEKSSCITRDTNRRVNMPNQNAITLLKKDHATVKQLFVREEELTKQAASKVSVFNEIKAALQIHASIEEEIFYPAVKKARSEHVKDEVREGYEEHKQIKSLLAQISSITPADETYDMKIKVLREDVEHHVKDEESEMFPDARKFLGDSRLTELGAELEARKQQLENHPASKSTSGNQSSAHTAK